MRRAGRCAAPPGGSRSAGSASRRSSASPAGWRAAPRAAGRDPRTGRRSPPGCSRRRARRPSPRGRRTRRAESRPVRRPCRRYSRAATAPPPAPPCKRVPGATSRPLVAASVAFMSTRLNAYRCALCAASSRPSSARLRHHGRGRAPAAGGGGALARLDRAHDHRGALCTAHALPRAAHRPARRRGPTVRVLVLPPRIIVASLVRLVGAAPMRGTSLNLDTIRDADRTRPAATGHISGAAERSDAAAVRTRGRRRRRAGPRSRARARAPCPG